MGTITLPWIFVPPRSDMNRHDRVCNEVTSPVLQILKLRILLADDGRDHRVVHSLIGVKRFERGIVTLHNRTRRMKQ